jgi:hypothetical protein
MIKIEAPWIAFTTINTTTLGFVPINKETPFGFVVF